MIQFTKAENDRLKEKLQNNNSILEVIKKKVEPVLKYGVKVPDRTIATWRLNYVCPEHSVTLIYDYGKDGEYICPICKKNFQEPRYEGAWWRYTNGITRLAAYNAGLMWILTDDETYRKIAEEILTKFTDYYPNYEVHGDIPYNNPGKLGSQTLCEGSCVRMLAMAFDLIRDTLQETLQQRMISDLFEPSCEVLKKYRMNQIHNHECIVNSGLGITGLIIGRDDYVDFAVNTKYGFRYQLENAVLKDHFWFESTFGYHYFAFEAFMLFEKVASGTKYSMLDMPNYRDMLLMPIKLLQPNNHLPSSGDGGASAGGMFEELSEFYEFPYAVYKEPEFAKILNKIYSVVPRDGLEAFLYGVDEIPNVGEIELKNYHNAADSGFTVLRGNNDNYLMFKHGMYGGEHDHYDKLGIHYIVNNEYVCADMGTVGYGAPLHYGFFKTTMTHNTVSINGQNQPPANGDTVNFKEYPNGDIYVEGTASWQEKLPEIDSFIIEQWDTKSYVGITMYRGILFTDEYMLEAFLVENPQGRSVDWAIHAKGEYTFPKGEQKSLNSLGDNCTAFTFMKDVKQVSVTGISKTVFETKQQNFYLFSAVNQANTLLFAKGPDNPPYSDITYMYNRVISDNTIIFANVFEVSKNKKSVITDLKINFDGNTVKFDFNYNGELRTFTTELGKKQ